VSNDTKALMSVIDRSSSGEEKPECDLFTLHISMALWSHAHTATAAGSNTKAGTIHIILNLSRGMPYCSMLFTKDLESLDDRKENLSPETSSLV